MIVKLLKFIMLIILLIAGVCFYFYSDYQNTLASNIKKNDTTVKVFEIDEGLSAYQVLAKLKLEGVIDDKQETVLKIYLKIEKKPKFKEGTFKIAFDKPLKDLPVVLETPIMTDIWVTIPEGLRKDEIAKIIAADYEGKEGAVFSAKEFLANAKDPEYINSIGLTGVTDLEGYLFPDKYLMPAQATTDYVIRTLVTNFKDKVGTVTKQQLIIASMIEREGLSDVDRPGISDVIRKRLKEGWLLQIDATLLYYYKDWKHVITVADKELDQPYNTYKRTGLIPTPICNPGLSAISAAKTPKKNNYYYYIHDNNGNVYFATTLEEHNANVARYLR